MTSSAYEIDIHPVCDACWSTERPNLLNASTRSVEFGAHDFQTLAGLVAGMRGEGGTGPDPESPLIVRGHELEDDAVNMIAKLRPSWRIALNQNHYVDHQNRLGAIPDALVTDPDRPGIGALQIKVVSAPVYRRKWAGGETPPLGHLLQLTQEMMLIPDCTWGAIGALVIGDFSFHAAVFPLERNTQAEIRLRTAAVKFWETFDRGDQPAIDFERDGALIELMYPTETPGKIIDLSTDNAIGELLERREILKDTAKDIDKRLKATETEIRAKLGDAEAALVPGWRVTHKTQERKEHTVAATSFRVLRTVENDERRRQEN